VIFDGRSPDTQALAMIYALQTLLGDAIVIYRCYVVWQSVSVILLPVATWVTFLAIWLTLVGYGNHSTSSWLFSRQGAMLLNSFYALTLITNVISTGLLAFRIWTINRATSQQRATKSRILPLMNVCLDSGILYTTILTVSIILFTRKSQAIFIVQDMLVPTIAFTFYMVIIRVGMVFFVFGDSEPNLSKPMASPVNVQLSSHTTGSSISRV